MDLFSPQILSISGKVVLRECIDGTLNCTMRLYVRVSIVSSNCAATRSRGRVRNVLGDCHECLAMKDERVIRLDSCWRLHLPASGLVVCLVDGGHSLSVTSFHPLKSVAWNFG